MIKFNIAYGRSFGQQNAVRRVLNRQIWVRVALTLWETPAVAEAKAM